MERREQDSPCSHEEDEVEEEGDEEDGTRGTHDVDGISR